MVLCECALEVAEQEAQRRLTQQMLELTEQIADEIMETAEEYEPQADN